MPRCSKSPRSLPIGRELIVRKLILSWRGIEIPVGFEPAFITLRNRIVSAQGKQASTCCADLHPVPSAMVKKRVKQNLFS